MGDLQNTQQNSTKFSVKLREDKNMIQEKFHSSQENEKRLVAGSSGKDFFCST